MTSPFSVEYVPPPPPEPGRFVVRSRDRRFPDLHLLPDEAFELYCTLAEALEDRIRAREREGA